VADLNLKTTKNLILVAASVCYQKVASVSGTVNKPTMKAELFKKQMNQVCYCLLRGTYSEFARVSIIISMAGNSCVLLLERLLEKVTQHLRWLVTLS